MCNAKAQSKANRARLMEAPDRITLRSLSIRNRDMAKAAGVAMQMALRTILCNIEPFLSNAAACNCMTS